MKKLITLVFAALALNTQASMIEWGLGPELITAWGLNYSLHDQCHVFLVLDQDDNVERFTQALSNFSTDGLAGILDAQTIAPTSGLPALGGVARATPISGLLTAGETYSVYIFALFELNSAGLAEYAGYTETGYWLGSGPLDAQAVANAGDAPATFFSSRNDDGGFWSPIPEPTTSLLVLTGAAALLLRRRRNK